MTIAAVGSGHWSLRPSEAPIAKAPGATNPNRSRAMELPFPIPATIPIARVADRQRTGMLLHSVIDDQTSFCRPAKRVDAIAMTAPTPTTGS
jgi:hypothetical protein